MRNDGLFHVTGVLVNGRRFKRIVTRNKIHALGINLFRGNVWKVDERTGKRKLIKSIYN